MEETKYKQTEIGLIPEDWGCKSIGEVGEVCMCKRVMKEQTTTTGLVPFYKIGTFGREPDAYISEELFTEYKNKYSYPHKGDILVSAAGTIGRTVIFDGEPSYFQDSNIVWIDNDEKLVINKFLFYVYSTIEWNTSETTIKRLYNDNFKKLLFPIPPLPEQQAIASALTSVDNLIASLDKQIAKTQSVKQGAMQQLLTMLNPEDVKYECFHDVCLFVRGVTYNKEQEISVKGDGYSILRANNITLGTNTLNFEDVKVVCRDVRIKEEQFLHKNDILMCAGSGSKEHVGKVAYIDKDIDYAFGGFMAVIRTKTNLYSKFLFYILSSNSFKDYLDQAISCCTINNINSSMMRDFLIPIPSIETQHRIASTLTAIDDQISALEAKRKKYEMVKVGMMQQLLTGKIRLK